MRLAGRMLPGSGAGPFPGQSESSGLPMSPKARCRSPAFGPRKPRGRGRALSGVAALSGPGEPFCGAALPGPGEPFCGAAPSVLGVPVRVAAELSEARRGAGREPTGVVSITVARRAAVSESTVSARTRGTESRADAASCEDESEAPAPRAPSAQPRAAAIARATRSADGFAADAVDGRSGTEGSGEGEERTRGNDTQLRMRRVQRNARAVPCFQPRLAMRRAAA